MTSAGTPTAIPDQPSVFLSYARADRKRALPVIAALEKAGIRVWWDGLLEGGDTFLPTTEAALESADAVVVLWSRTSIDSHWVRDEATRGRDRRRLVPLSIDGSHAPLGFRQFQVIDISKWRGKPDAPEIAAAIRAVAALAGRPSQLPIQNKAAGPSRRALLVGAGSMAALAAGGLIAWRGMLPGGSVAADNSIAVIPFSNLGDPAEAYFSAGLSEELRTALARDPALRISAPTSSAGFRDASGDVLKIAKELGVAHVLRGSVRRGAERIRITVELLTGKDANLAWTHTLDRPFSDVLAMQVEIAAIVARALSAELNAQAIAAGQSGDLALLGGTGNVQAFDAYLRGKALVETSESETSDRAALDHFDAALKLDPAYASALAARSKILAAIANETGNGADVRKFYDRAVESAATAIARAPKLAEAHSALGYALYNGRLDPKAAREPYDRSRELGAGDADVLRTFALFCAFTNRAADAVDAMDTALSLDPLNPGAFRAAGFIALAKRDYPATADRMRRALALNPKLSVAHSAIGSALYLAGRLDEARAAFAAEPLALFRLQGQAIIERKLGHQDSAQRALDQLVAQYGDNANYQQAQVLAQWGDRDGALDRLERAAAARDSGLLLAQADPLLDPLRSAPRFAELLSRIGLS